MGCNDIKITSQHCFLLNSSFVLIIPDENSELLIEYFKIHKNSFSEDPIMGLIHLDEWFGVRRVSCKLKVIKTNIFSTMWSIFLLKLAKFVYSHPVYK